MLVREKYIKSLRAYFYDIEIKYIKLILLYLIIQGYIIKDRELGILDIGSIPCRVYRI